MRSAAQRNNLRHHTGFDFHMQGLYVCYELKCLEMGDGRAAILQSKM